MTIADDTFATFLATAWRPEFDGSAADDAPGEPRGNTHWGVVRDTWNSAMHRGCVVSDPNFSTAPQSDFATVIRWTCWTPLWCNQLCAGGSPGVAIVLANMAMAAGSPAAVRILQRVLGVREDGVMGPHTTAAAVASVHRGMDLIGQLTDADEAWFDALIANRPEFRQFRAGWLRRAEVFEEVARSV